MVSGKATFNLVYHTIYIHPIGNNDGNGHSNEQLHNIRLSMPASGTCKLVFKFFIASFVISNPALGPSPPAIVIPFSVPFCKFLFLTSLSLSYHKSRNQ